MATLQKLKEVQILAEAEAGGDAAAHASLLHAIDRLRLQVETAAETTSRLNFQMLQNICIRIALEYNIFKAVAARNGEPTSAADLARDSRVDELFIIRVMRVLTAIGLADEVGENTYAASNKTVFQTQEGAVGAIKHHYDLDMAMGGRLVDYMRGPGIHQFAEKPPEISLFEYTWGTYNIFDLLEKHQEQKKSFDDYMAGRPRSKSWFEVFPVVEKFNNLRNEPREVLLVDVAGGVGHETVRFNDRYPDMPGRLVVQDLPLTLDKIGSLPHGIESMRYDFFTPQPIKGARAYFFRDIMHNWSDQNCAKILANTVEAMDADYSTLLIDDYVMPRRGAPLRAAEMDILMFTHLSALERTVTQWEKLFDSVGLQLVQVWPIGRGEESVLEVRKVKK